MFKRRETKQIQIGNILIGGSNPITVESMCNTDTRNIEETVKQIHELEKIGCEIIRVAVPDEKAAKVLGEIKRQIKIPLIADIHFSEQLAIEAMKQGIDSIRINPGNIGSLKKIKRVVRIAKEKNVSIRIGVNSGSLEKKILEKYNHQVTAQGIVDSAFKHIKILEALDFDNIIISLKATDIDRTVMTYQLLAKQINYPFHLGITEAGTIFRGTIVSSIGIGFLLHQGIGDTIRVSLTASPIEEVKVGWEILKALKLRQRGVDVFSCPTCGRTEIDLIKLTKQVEEMVSNIKEYFVIAVMGCIVNGPGEAKEADIGIIGGKKMGLITRKGKVVKRVEERYLLQSLRQEINKFLSEKNKK